MGYYIFSYGIDTKKIKAVFGSNNEGILEQVQENDVFEGYCDFNPNGEATDPVKALSDIVKGNRYDVKSGYAYGYAVIGICATLGSELPYSQEIKMWYETDFIDKYLAKDFGVKNFKMEEVFFVENSNPFIIPKIDDWPMISVMSRQDLLNLKDKLSKIKISDEDIEALEAGDGEDDEEKSFAYAHIKGIIENIDFCLENNLDMASFCH